MAFVLAAFCGLPAICQEPAPVYRVTVVQHNLDAVNYQYGAGPTKVDFRGTVLLPTAKGDATVDPRKGSTGINAKFEGLASPQRFGQEYLSYVLWAITPDGAPHNLGEIVPNGSDKAHLPVTTNLQTFALMVTAEPYGAVRHPSDLVVLENQVRPDTVGSLQPVQVKTELMPRGQYTWNVPASQAAVVASARKVPLSQYRATLELYEAQNALGIARADGAQKYAPDVYSRAQQELQEAQQLHASAGGKDSVVQHARAATEIAEDARIIAGRRRDEDAVIAARKGTEEAQQAKLRAEATAQKEKERADSAQAQAQLDQAARVRAEMDANAARAREQAAEMAAAAKPTPPPVVVQVAPNDENAAAKAERERLLERLDTIIVTRDTPQGLDATVSDGDFNGAGLRPEAAGSLIQLAAVLNAHPGLRVSVEGNSATPAGADLAGRRAETVAAALIRDGVPGEQISTQNLGDSRLIVSDDTTQGRIENRRVEIVISGRPIGALPVWDQTYSLSLNRK
jgi:outer membrane protein OmpA-like peptidoglycan-associated protein